MVMTPFGPSGVLFILEWEEQKEDVKGHGVGVVDLFIYLF